MVGGRLQFRYNLGSGEGLLVIESIRVNDARFHDVTLTRTELSIELVVDGMYVNRTASPGSEATLDVDPDHFFVGASVNVEDSTLSNGLRGCVTGLRLDRKDVPVGGENNHFTTLAISDGVRNGCPIGSLFETPQSDTNVYTTIGVVLGGLCIISFVFVMSCVALQWHRKRTRTHTYNPPSREGSRRRARSPVNGEFSWHQPPTYRKNLDSPQGDYHSSPGPADNQTTFRLNNTSPTFDFDTKSGRHQPPCPVTDVALNAISETSFSDLRGRNDSVSSSRRRHRLQPVQEGFSAISRLNPSFIDEPQFNQESTDGPSSQTGGQQQSRHSRSPSADLISSASVGTQLSDIALGKSIDGDAAAYIQKRTEAADLQLEGLNIDSMTHYKDEGSYEPLGSIGSLYDFVRDLEQPDASNERMRNTERNFSSTAFAPTHSPPPRIKEAALPHSPLRPKSPSSGQPAMPQTTDDDQNFTRQSFSQRSGKKRSSLRGSLRRTGHSVRMTNIMDKFHNITVGNRPADSMETRLV